MVKLIKERGVAVAQAVGDLNVAESILRRWLREGVADPEDAFPEHGQSKTEQQEVTQLCREVAKLKSERDI